MIAGAIAAAMIGSRAGVLILLRIAGAPRDASMLVGTLGLTTTLLLPLPFLMDVLQLSARWNRSRRGVTHVICALLYIIVSGGFSAAWRLIFTANGSRGR